jgi:hypothetical protein
VPGWVLLIVTLALSSLEILVDALQLLSHTLLLDIPGAHPATLTAVLGGYILVQGEIIPAVQTNETISVEPVQQPLEAFVLTCGHVVCS